MPSSKSSSSKSSTGGRSRPSRSRALARESIICRTASKIVSRAVKEDVLRASPARSACACFSSCVNAFPVAAEVDAAPLSLGGDIGTPRSSLGDHIVDDAAPGVRNPGVRASTLGSGVRGARR